MTMTFNQEILKDFFKSYIVPFIVLVLVALCLGSLIFLGVANKRRDTALALKVKYLAQGYEAGHNDVSHLLEIYKVSAIECGVAKYVVDPKKGKTSFVWILPDGSNVVTMLR